MLKFLLTILTVWSLQAADTDPDRSRDLPTPNQSAAAEGRNEHERLIERLMALSGLNDQIPQITDTINLRMQSILQRIPDPEYRDRFSEIVTLAFDETRILDTIRSEIAKGVSDQEAKELLEWYATDLGARITDLERQAPRTPEEIAQMRQDLPELIQNGARMDLMKKLDEAIHVSEFRLQMRQIIYQLMSKMSGKDPNDQAQKKAWDQWVEKARPKIEKMTRETMLYIYRDLSDEELRTYIDAMQKGAMQAFYRSSQKGIKEAMSRSFDEMMKGTMQIVDELKKKGPSAAGGKGTPAKAQ